jgi:hypothetical protein
MLVFKKYENIPCGTIFFGANCSHVDRFIKTRHKSENRDDLCSVSLSTGEMIPFYVDSQILVEIDEETS